MNEAPTISRRERLRVQTRQRLQMAAVELVLRDGLDRATINAISDRADVSPRTFFNYFESKEDAILGLHDMQIADAPEWSAHADDDHPAPDPIAQTVRLLMEVLGSTITTSVVRSGRMEIIRRYPELVGRQMVQMSRMHHDLTAATRAVLKRERSFAAQTDRDLTASAKAVLGMCGGAVRAVIHEWATDDADVPADQLERRAVTVARESIARIGVYSPNPELTSAVSADTASLA
ncbi:TetR/AcrR family transcriptional regulator [Glaciihabitans sp. dw_435]|uniref:TetR/AcrR family transcriptional regulator n=1 Tax=Glaciihabitans sp. dw_435 TaxID=2720081 RepID=UPI001BD26109|nr:TetR/AcrR family transcriptional regulator [Glaciihabitans sp. dw_435]